MGPLGRLFRAVAVVRFRPMLRKLRPIALLAALLGALLVGVASAGAGTLDVHADYIDNGTIDGAHSIQDLRAALAAAEGDAQYRGLANAVSDALDEQLLGRVPDPTPAAAVASSRNDLGVLPSPRSVADAGGPPWPLVALAALAAVLALSGAGSSLYRRLNRHQR